MRWDAYAGNIAGTPPAEVAEVLGFAVHGRVERARPRGRYGQVLEVKDGPTPVGWVAHDPMLDTAYFELKGERTPDGVACIRRHWADRHGVSRMDACEDYDAPGAFDSLVRLLDGAKDPRVKSDEIRPRDGDRGRTIYYGSPTSRVYVRCYEAGKMRERLHYGRPDWARAEAQVRPGKAVEKRLAASVTPLQAWGFGAWTQRAAEALSQVEVPRFAPEVIPPTFDRTTLYLARAFRRHLEEMQADFGSWACIGAEFEAVWRADDEAKGSGPA